MKIFLHEITEQGTELDFSNNEKWVSDAVTRVDEKLDSEPFRKSAATQPARPIETHLSIRKVDNVVVISGKIKTSIQLICSRCATPFQMAARPQFSALFCKDPVMAGVAHLQRRKEDDMEIAKPVGQNHGFARHAHNYEADDESTFGGESGQDLDITYISEDFIELGDVLSEQLRLQVPFQPLCKEDCKGMCAQCGADLNLGRCACAKLAKATPFSVLKDLKLST